MIDKLNPLLIGDLEIKIPIVQGGMGLKVSTASLVSAVANCGGAGTIASVGLGFGTELNEVDFVKASREALQRQIRSAKELSKGVIGVNVLTALNNYEDLVRTAIYEKADFIVSGAGLPLRLPEFAENSSAKLIPIVSSGRAASIIIKSWKKRYNCIPDAFVVEGPLAGGHLGFSFEDLLILDKNPLEELVKEVIDVVSVYEKELGVSIPVIAAGGIFDGKDIARFLKMGAKGVQLATRFVPTFECDVSDKFKELYIAAKESDIVTIKSPVGMPARAVKTKLVEDVLKGKREIIKCNYRCLKTCNPGTTPYCIMHALYNAVLGNMDKAVVFAGKNVTKVNKIVSVKELMDELVFETVEEMNGCHQACL
ncbi:MAG: nitronate monooxygenase family protein [Candidatus Omnitrophica bacterium]|nr:nitronate monooxygenase family protein [Candidatus Omnitrophota bacterium]